MDWLVLKDASRIKKEREREREEGRERGRKKERKELVMFIEFVEHLKYQKQEKWQVSSSSFGGMTAFPSTSKRPALSLQSR